MSIRRFAIGVILAGCVSEYIHTHIGLGAAHYSLWVNRIAYLTKPLESLGMAIVYYYMADRLPGKSRFFHGLILGALVLLVKDGLIRQPLMNFLLPNTLREVLLLTSRVWLANVAAAMIICFIIRTKYPICS